MKDTSFMVGLKSRPFVLWINPAELQLDATDRFRMRLDEFLESGQIFLHLLVVPLGPRGLVGISIFWLGDSVGHAAAVGALISEEKFRDVKNVVRSQQAVEIWHGQIEDV